MICVLFDVPRVSVICQAKVAASFITFSFLCVVGKTKPLTMKFSTALILASMVNAASAFSAVAPPSSGAATGNPEPVDRSLRGIDKDEATFDPTTGDSPALTRNNNDQVWVPQVRTHLDICSGLRSMQNRFFPNAP
jgi:hypothetical protein